MALSYAVDQLTLAIHVLVTSAAPLEQRLQQVWTDQVANLWTSVYLPADLNERFKHLWSRYAETSDDPRSTALRALSPPELHAAALEIVDLGLAAVAADARGDEAASPPSGP